MRRSIISQVLTTGEINELGLNESVTTNCSSPFILNKECFLSISFSFLISIFLFFCTIVTIIGTLLTLGSEEATKVLILVIYAYLFVIFYIDLKLGYSMKYDIVLKKYNLSEVRKKMSNTFTDVEKKKENENKNPQRKNVHSIQKQEKKSYRKNNYNKKIKREKCIKKEEEEEEEDDDDDNNNDNDDEYGESGKEQKKNNSSINKLFSIERHVVIVREEDIHITREMNDSEELERSNEINEHNIMIEDNEITNNDYYNFDNMKDPNLKQNPYVNSELLKYIQYENNNYTINDKKYDIFLIISSLLSHFNIFCDVLFIHYLYGYSMNMFVVSLVLLFYYIAHTCILMKFFWEIIVILIGIVYDFIYQKTKTILLNIQKLFISIYQKGYDIFKRFFLFMINNKRIDIVRNVEEGEYTNHTFDSKMFLNKYVNYNSWCFLEEPDTNYLYSFNDIIINMITELKMEEYEDEYEEEKGSYRSNNNEENEKRNKKQIKENYQINQKKYEEALLPSYVQIIANISYLMSFFFVLNIIKHKYLSAYDLHAHISYTIVFFVWKILYTDIVMNLLKIYVLFYTTNNLLVLTCLLVSLLNIVCSYIINLIDISLYNDITL